MTGWYSVWGGLLVCGALFVGSSCARPAAGSISTSGFQHATYPYGVVPPLGQSLLPAEWALDNYFAKGGKIQPKSTPDYLTTFELDGDGDGKYEAKIEGFRYDLLYVNRKTGAFLFVRTLPLSWEDRQLELDIFTRRYVDELAGGGVTVVHSASEQKVSVVEKRRYTTTIESEGASKLAGRDAYEATITLKHVDQPTPEARLRVVFSRPGFTMEHRQFRARYEYPVLLMAVYHSRPEVFERGQPDFERFLGSIAVRGTRSYEAPQGDAPPPAEPAPEPDDAGGGEPPPADPDGTAGEPETDTTD